MERKDFSKYLSIVGLYGIVVISLIIGVNTFVDASSVISPQHTELAKLALSGNTVSVPENYNERVFQICIVDNLDGIPDTVVLGGSRGMYLGEEITGYSRLYNNCVSGACLEDYYALLGLYQYRFKRMPNRVIIETSPWIFYGGNPESRWTEDERYYKSACDLYKLVNKTEIPDSEDVTIENPYISLAYFRYNLDKLITGEYKQKGPEDARVSTDPDESADYPDGTIRYEASTENESDERLAKVRSAVGAYGYEESDDMTDIDSEKAASFEALIDYLQECGTEVVIFMQPFSPTQCKFSFDENLNPGYSKAYDYLVDLGKRKGLSVRGGFDSREFGLGDEHFMDSMHLDKKGVATVWKHIVL